MLKNKKDGIVIMNFSGIYRREQFQGEKVFWTEVQDISGTNCYCDGEAYEVLLSRIAEFPAEGIHFIDSGNYHYMSRIWLSKTKEPISLVVFDNHTDMQMPAFGGLLSCGGWIAAAFEEVENLQDVILIGPDEEAYSQVEPQWKERVKFLSREMLQDMSRESRAAFLKEALSGGKIPVYISVDKDVLCPESADTSWSQGDMKSSELLFLLKTVFDCAQESGREVCGVDICGESEAGESGNNEKNVKVNREILDCLRKCNFLK